MEYRILIVSEDATERNRLAETLIALPPAKSVSYQITTVGSVAAAQLQATRQRFGLVIVALSQQDDGLQLSSTLKELFPDMRLLLLCEQGVTRAQLKTARLIRASVAENTINAESLRAIVSDLLGTSSLRDQEHDVATTSSVAQPPPSSKLTADVLQPFFEPFLEELRRQTSAHIAVVIDKTGKVLGQSGEDTKLDVTALARVVASSLTASIGVEQILHEDETFHLNVYEGKIYDIYSANVGKDRFLALFFNKEYKSPKLGLVWLVMKRGAEKFSRLK